MYEIAIAEPNTLSPQDLEDIRWAHDYLEHPSFATRLATFIGTPLRQGLRPMPNAVHRGIRAISEFSIRKSLSFAIDSRAWIPLRSDHEHAHKILVTGAGALGGFFGPLTLLAELPVTTTLMLHSITGIAESEGEDLSTAEARQACLEVFALGGRSSQDEAAELGYYSLRVALGFHFSNALIHSAKPVLSNIPGSIELVRAIASRFGLVVSESVAARLIPVVGAASGALLNLVFMQHFQDIARAHFILRRLERTHGMSVIREEYQKVRGAALLARRGTDVAAVSAVSR